MKTEVTIKINNEYLPELYSLLNGELIAAKEVCADDKFCEKYPNLTRRARRTVENLTKICDQLLEEF